MAQPKTSEDLGPAIGTSGDLLADRRFAYAQSLAADGDHAAASDLFEQVLERVPTWSPAWLSLGLALEKGGHHAAALEALRRAEALDPDGRLGAALHVARLLDASPSTMPAPFVAALFDQYADRFEEHLLGALDYRAPTLIVEALDRVAPGRIFATALDLGCGTGLMGRALTGRVAALDGVDLSSRMIEKARGSALYRRLEAVDAADFLDQAAAGAYEIVVAADVFVYVGLLDGLMRHIARALSSEGILAFTVQRGDGAAMTLGSDMRFSHGIDYIRNAVTAAGLRMASIDDRSSRQDGGIAVPGLVVVATKA